MTYPFVGEIKMTKVIKDGKEVIEWEQVDMSKHAEGNLGIGSGQQPEPNITFHPGDPMKEVMRIDRHGVKVNPEYTVDEATQHVLDALSAHIQHTVNHAVAQEREACAKVADSISEDQWALYKGRPPYTGQELERASDYTQGKSDGAEVCAAAIRARSNT